VTSTLQVRQRRLRTPALCCMPLATRLETHVAGVLTKQSWLAASPARRAWSVRRWVHQCSLCAGGILSVFAQVPQCPRAARVACR